MNKPFATLSRVAATAAFMASVTIANAQAHPDASARHSIAPVQAAHASQDIAPPLGSGAYSTYCLYHYAGTGVIARCYDGRINANSRVFVELSEYASNAATDRFIGAARMSTHNVRPFNGGVDVWTDVDWGSALNVRMDLLVDP